MRTAPWYGYKGQSYIHLRMEVILVQLKGFFRHQNFDIFFVHSRLLIAILCLPQII